jgi:hypothetical protein
MAKADSGTRTGGNSKHMTHAARRLNRLAYVEMATYS